MDMDLLMGGISSNKGQEAMESWLNETLFPKMMICEEEIKANYSILPQSSKQSKVRKQRKKRKKQHLHRNLKVTIDNFSSEGCQLDDTNEEAHELSMEYKRFIEETKRHREERKNFRKFEENEKEYILDTTGPAKVLTPSEAPPDQHPGHKRREHLIDLYGSQAHKIHSMEVHLQALFDEQMVARNPSYWPIIPLKL